MNPPESSIDAHLYLGDIHRLAKFDLECLLKSTEVETPKIFIIEPSIDRFLFLGKALDKAIISRYCVQKVLPLDQATTLKEETACHYFFILRPKVSTCLTLRLLLEKSPKLVHRETTFLHICFVPYPTISCMEALRTSTARLLDIQRTQLACLDIDFLPVDDGLLTMEISTCYHDLFVVKDATSIKVIARALLKLQAVHLGRFHNITAHGEISCNILRAMQALHHSFLDDCQETETVWFDRDDSFLLDSLLIVDRTLDPVSPLLSQKTYEGLVDAVFEINMGGVELPHHMKDPKGSPYGILSLWNHDDIINDSLRYLSFGDAGKFLNSIACEIQNEYNDRHDIQDVSELRNFVKNLPATQRRHRLSTLHAAIFETLAMEIRQKGLHRHFDIETMIAYNEIEKGECLGYLNECIHRRFPLVHVFRIILLVHDCSSFWNAQLWKKLKETLVGAYGAFEVIRCVEAIEKSRWFFSERKGSLWKEWKKQLTKPTGDGIVDEESSHEGVHFQSMITYALEEYILHTVCGKPSRHTFDSLTDAHSQVRTDKCVDDKHKVRVFMLCVVGGTSLAEIESIRMFERDFNQESAVKIRILVFTTNLVNGKKFVQTILGDEVS